MNSLYAALLGHGVQHSLSPTLHRAAARSVGFEARYELIDVALGDLPATLEGLANSGMQGWNVTAPYKSAVFHWVSQTTPLAERLGAVNTVVVEADGQTVGHNTDVAGFRMLLGAWTGKRALVLGAGGAAASVVEVLSDRDTAVDIVNRSEMAADALRARLAPHASAFGLAELQRCLTGADLLVNAIGPRIQPLLTGLDLSAMTDDGLVLDLAYGSQARPLLHAAHQAARESRDGLEMLIGQGIAAFELWTGARPDLDSVRSALR